MNIYKSVVFSALILASANSFGATYLCATDRVLDKDSITNNLITGTWITFEVPDKGDGSFTDRKGIASPMFDILVDQPQSGPADIADAPTKILFSLGREGGSDRYALSFQTKTATVRLRNEHIATVDSDGTELKTVATLVCLRR